MTPTTTHWAMEPHTKAKHDILRRHLNAWLPIMSSWKSRLLVLDGFAGPGVYDGGEPGSPALIMEILRDHKHAKTMATCEFLLLFNEQDPDRHTSLVKVVSAIEAERGFPKNVTVATENSSFGALAKDVCDHLDAEGLKLAPTFAFLDPFGYKDLSMATLARLLSGPSTEALIFLDINSLSRFAESGVADANFEELYGTDLFKSLSGSTPDERREELRDLYESQLKAKVGFTYTQSFLMRGPKNRSICYLVFGTRHITGLRAMKHAMWKVDPSGAFSFSDRDVANPVLFTDDPDTAPLEDAVWAEFKGKSVTVETLEAFALTNTPFLDTHLRKGALIPLEAAGRITTVVNADGRNRRTNTYPKNSVITFAAS